MFALGSTFHHNVVNADLHSLIDQGFEDLCHQPLISSANILKPKWHNSITVQPVWCHKDCFFLIWLEHGDLVVLNESVYEGEHFVPVSGIYYLVYSGQKKKVIIWANIIQVGVINIDSQFPTLFWNDHHIRQPVRIFNLPYESGN